jgi:hypothetical protein
VSTFGSQGLEQTPSLSLNVLYGVQQGAALGFACLLVAWLEQPVVLTCLTMYRVSTLPLATLLCRHPPKVSASCSPQHCTTMMHVTHQVLQAHAAHTDSAH